jgi:hypothetical protein
MRACERGNWLLRGGHVLTMPHVINKFNHHTKW